MWSQGSQSSQNSQNLADSRFTELLKPIKELTDRPIKNPSQNFEVNLARLLEQYTDIIKDFTLTEDGGNPVNFAEAAMILQSSSLVYSKKVDYLYTVIQKTVELLTSRNSGHEEGNEDGENDSRGNRRRKNLGQDDMDFIVVEMGKNINLKKETTAINELKNLLKFIQITPRQLIEREGKEMGSAKVELYLGTKFELLGSKKDFRLNSQYNSATGMIGENLTAEEQIIDPNGDYSFDESCEEDLEDNREDDSVVPTNNHAQTTTQEPLELTVAGAAAVTPHQQDASEALGEEAINPAVEEFAMDADIEDNYDNCEEAVMDISERALGQRARLRNRENIIRAPVAPPAPPEPAVDPWEQQKPYENHEKCDLISRKSVRRLPPWLSAERRDGSNNKEGGHQPRVAEAITPISNFISSAFRQSTAIGSAKYPELAEVRALEKERRKTFLSNMKKERARMLKAGRSQPQIDNALVDSDPDDDEYHDDDFRDDPQPDDGAVDVDAPQLPEHFPDPHMGGTVGVFAMDMDIADNHADHEPSSQNSDSYEQLVAKRVADFIKNSQAYVLSSELDKKVSAWHSLIAPRLETVEKRAAFDIHGYGSDILANFTQRNEKTLPFSSVITGKPKEDIARYFLSTLMLANCMNVHIECDDDDGLAMDNVRITFLSNKRHHEDLETFQSASQQDQ